MSKLKLLIIDGDLPFVGFLRKLLLDVPEFHSSVHVQNGADALVSVRKHKPDIVALATELPNMSGLELIKPIIKIDSKIGIVVLTTQSRTGESDKKEAMKLGAYRHIIKPISKEKFDLRSTYLKSRFEYIANIYINRNLRGFDSLNQKFELSENEELFNKQKAKSFKPNKIDIVVIGISTGGPPALYKMIPMLPKSLKVPVVVVQHMPDNFTESLANGLNNSSKINVAEVKDGEVVKPGIVYIAKGGKQTKLVKEKSKIILRLTDDPMENFVLPTADYTFRSVDKIYGKNTLCIIMTGMGRDGQKGALQLKKSGATVFVQNESSCAINSMPSEAILIGAVDKIVPLDKLAEEITNSVNRF